MAAPARLLARVRRSHHAALGLGVGGAVLGAVSAGVSLADERLQHVATTSAAGRTRP